MQLIKLRNIILALVIIPSSAFGIIFPEEPIARTFSIQTELIALEQADEKFERKLALNGLVSYPLNSFLDYPILEKFRLIGKVHLSPDYGKDTAETAVFQSFVAVGGLLEYSWIKWVRFYANLGPSLLYQKISYQFESETESFSHNSFAWELNLGFDYAIMNELKISYSLGRRQRIADDRLDKMQTLGIKYAI